MFVTQFVIYYVLLNVIQCQNWRNKRPTVRIEQGVLEGVSFDSTFTDSRTL
jgi:hypothetical protein